MSKIAALVALSLVALAPSLSAAKINVLDYGAKADGRNDDTAAIQRTLDAAAKDRGGIVEMPKGLYRVEDHLVIPPGVCLSGEWQAPHHANTEQGTVILATGYANKEDGPALISLGQSSAIKGITIFYPDQDPAAVKPYPWAIQGKGMHGSVIDVTLVNPYEFNGKPTVKAVPATVEAAKPTTKNGGDKPEINKAQAVREYLTANPEAGPSAVVAVLKKQGIDVAPNYVAAIKSKLNKTSTVKKAAKPAPEAVPAVVEKPVTTGGTITLEQIKQVAQTVKSLGGLKCATEVLDVIKEMGGAKKFKELAEAIAVPEPEDVVF